MPSLTKIGRTAISPFVAFVRILQLRNPIKDVDSGQQATSGMNYSIGTDTVKGKEFYIPLDNIDFVNPTQLPFLEKTWLVNIEFSLWGTINSEILWRDV